MLNPLTNGIRKLLSGYTGIYNKRYGFSGSLFRQKTKSKCLSDIILQDATKFSIQDFCVICFHYIRQNPFRAKLVNRLENWEYSSFKRLCRVKKWYFV